jgi:hypothetical protein
MRDDETHEISSLISNCEHNKIFRLFDLLLVLPTGRSAVAEIESGQYLESGRMVLGMNFCIEFLIKRAKTDRILAMPCGKS